ncbi:SulP family inorganic anion transporter [Nocardioides alcanivorans]|uniref:SulP family inorganic anion transporter n=1 Tax=Nocardioides alcanivorans TaxID=2897352 RepID=UPI001EEA525A|nr:SulP family inorganic anion transporter [Nocardioides alcanivorans]
MWRDLLAGLVTGAVVIPQAMAYATIAGLPVEIGLYTCMLPMLVYALMGGSRTLSMSTTSTIAILTATTVGSLPDRTDAQLLRAVFTLTVLVGTCLLLMRLFRLGSVVEQVSPATMTGVKTGVGLTVVATQLPALLGVSSGAADAGFFRTVADVARKVESADVGTVAISVTAVASLLLLRRFLPRIPGPLVVVTVAILVVACTPIEEHGLDLVGRVPTGLPTPSVPLWSDVLTLLPGALAIAVMAFMETVIVARAQRRRADPPIDPQRELLANGIAALAGGFSQSLPPAGGLSQSAVNQRAGAASQLAGITTAALAVLVALFLGPVLADLPAAVLASMVLVAVVGLIRPDEFTTLLRIDRAEFWVAVITAAAGLTAGLITAVAVGVGLTLVLVLREVSRSQAQPWEGNDVGNEVMALRLQGTVYAGNARPTQDDVLARALSEPGLRTVVLDCVAVRRVTVPLLDTLEALHADLDSDGVELVVAALAPELLDVARRSPWFAGLEADGHVKPTVEEAVRG